MMWKLIFIGIIIWFAIHIFKRMTSQPDTSRTQKQSNAESTTQAENMVQCATCAVHLPRSEAFLVNGNFYCSQTHIKHQ